MAGTAVAVLQWRLRFCVGYALAGLSNFGPLGARDSVGDPADLAADRRRALRTIAGCSAYAVAVTGVLLLL